MASPYRTGSRSEALTTSPEIFNLARQILPQEDLDRAIRLSTMLVSSKSIKRAAIEELQNMVAPPPKRPLYYAQYELGFLPHWTRDAIRDLGDYIDILTKHVAYELTKDTRVRGKPLGVSIRILEATKALPQHLLEWLKQYNSFLYRPGKHDFNLPPGRRGHRFTSQEVVLTAFVTMNLAILLKQYSNCSPELNCRHLQ